MEYLGITLVFIVGAIIYEDLIRSPFSTQRSPSSQRSPFSAQRSPFSTQRSPSDKEIELIVPEEKLSKNGESIDVNFTTE
jgi:hypothetical protein